MVCLNAGSKYIRESDLKMPAMFFPGGLFVYRFRYLLIRRTKDRLSNPFSRL